MQRILVTGGAGFIGIHTVYDLIKVGYYVVILDSLKTSSFQSIKNLIKLIKKYVPEKLSNFEFIKGDVRDNVLLNEIFLKNKESGTNIKGVIHFAGLKSISESIDQPLPYWDTNVSGTINLLKIMESYNCRIFLFSSSASIYGNSTKKFLFENDEIKPIHPYGGSKATVENLLEDLSNNRNDLWLVASLRYFNPIGAHTSGLIGEDPKNQINNIFPLINKVGYGESKFLNIYGKDWPTPDGTCVRDYIHIMDLSEGHLHTLQYLLNEKPKKYLSLNLGTGKGVSILELVKKFQDTNKIKIPYIFSNRREGDVASLVADNSKAKQILNWSPTRNLEQMCKDGWNWKLLSNKN